MKIIEKFIIVVMLVFVVFTSTWLLEPIENVNSSKVYATNNADFGGDSATSEIRKKGNAILSAILWFGYAIALGMVIYIGIKYIMGAADAKANMKSAITNWLIGAFLVFMCTTIIGWVTGIVGENSAQEVIDTGKNLTSSGTFD